MSDIEMDDFIKIYKLFREYVQHEDQLINHRTSWLVTVQSVLLATFGFSIQKYLEVIERVSENPNASRIEETMKTLDLNYHIFLIGLTLIGFIVSFGATLSIGAAHKAQNQVNALWDKRYKDLHAAAYLPYIAGGGSQEAKIHGSYLSFYLPIFFIVLWIIAFVALFQVNFSISFT